MSWSCSVAPAVTWMGARWTNAWRELQSRLSLSSPAPRSGERVVVILVHQKLLFNLRPSYCAFDFCFCFCRVSLILVPWIRVTVLSCLAPVHLSTIIPHCCLNSPKQLSHYFSLFPWLCLGFIGISAQFRSFILYPFYPREKLYPRACENSIPWLIRTTYSAMTCWILWLAKEESFYCVWTWPQWPWKRTRTRSWGRPVPTSPTLWIISILGPVGRPCLRLLTEDQIPHLRRL